MKPARKFWPLWIIANFVAFGLSFGLLGTIDYLVDLAGAHGTTFIGIFAHLAGIVIGAVLVAHFQMLVISRYLSELRNWRFVTGIAYAFAFLIGEILGGLSLSLFLSFTLFGAASGILQSYLLLRRGIPGLTWALATCLGFAAGGAAATAMIFFSFAVAGMGILETTPRIVTLATVGGSAGGIGAALSGPILMRVLKNPHSN